MSSLEQQYVVFKISDNFYGISIQDVAEIIRMQTVKWVPHSRDEFLGVIHIRERVIPIISLHRVFSAQEREVESKTRMIVLEYDNQEVGFIVDEVDHVMHLSHEFISPPPHLAQSEWIAGVYHHDSQTIALLNLQTLLEHVDIEAAVE